MPKGPLVEARPEAPLTASLLAVPAPVPAPPADHFSMGMVVVAAFGLFAFLYVLMLGRPVVRSDEAWLLWVAHRVAHGQPLYRDVYSVTTPLPIWIAAGSVWLFGTH